jgi:hypothetical protein
LWPSGRCSITVGFATVLPRAASKRFIDSLSPEIFALKYVSVWLTFALSEQVAHFVQLEPALVPARPGFAPEVVEPKVDALEVRAATGRQLSADPLWLNRVSREHRRFPRLLGATNAFAELAEHELLGRRVVAVGRASVTK